MSQGSFLRETRSVLGCRNRRSASWSVQQQCGLEYPLKHAAMSEFGPKADLALVLTNVRS